MFGTHLICSIPLYATHAINSMKISDNRRTARRRILDTALKKKSECPAFVSELRNECTDHSAVNSAITYPRLYGSPSAGCDRSEEPDLCAQCSECQSCEQRNGMPYFVPIWEFNRIGIR